MNVNPDALKFLDYDFESVPKEYRNKSTPVLTVRKWLGTKHLKWIPYGRLRATERWEYRQGTLVKRIAKFVEENLALWSPSVKMSAQCARLEQCVDTFNNPMKRSTLCSIKIPEIEWKPGEAPRVIGQAAHAMSFRTDGLITYDVIKDAFHSLGFPAVVNGKKCEGLPFHAFRAAEGKGIEKFQGFLDYLRTPGALLSIGLDYSQVADMDLLQSALQEAES